MRRAIRPPGFDPTVCFVCRRLLADHQVGEFCRTPDHQACSTRRPSRQTTPKRISSRGDR